ncbi:WecB/TagA/CpsF family glycosyltransferase [Microbacterium betulae]|uniref:WecB/TagA/CpsF family glycosyltransferase n=1 Tax=Microbacterium betulae TaxID=2981139 RepID=A0AA97FFE1_9MICO|nr:WecB/TagA/CpsF family glycosyltransferase [Microbacterium sp. AB]WOF22631.1 WecB/TagA/CpsF family glycosyltransferase [Microbacterium sp. AB]
MSVLLPGRAAVPASPFAWTAPASRRTDPVDETVLRPGPVCVVDDVPVRPVTLAGLVDLVMGMTGTSAVDVLVGVNAHVVNLARRDEALRRFLATTTLNYADGQSVVWAAGLLGGELPERVATTDLAAPLLDAAARDGLPVYFFGGRPGVAQDAADRIAERTPGIAIRTTHGYVEDTASVLEDIRAHGTRILLVGLGDPLQESWIERHRDALPPVVLTCGGLFDWLSGSHRRAPRWMIRAGLEWLWRLLIEPRRLAHRYLVGNPAFVRAVLRQHRAARRAARVAPAWQRTA